jgi:hypothetical protein
MAVLALIPVVSVPSPAPHTRVVLGRFLARGRAHGPTFSGKPTLSQKHGLKGGGKLFLICWSWPPPTSEVGLKSQQRLVPNSTKENHLTVWISFLLLIVWSRFLIFDVSNITGGKKAINPGL